MDIKAGDRISSKLRKDIGTVINRGTRSITIKWRNSTEHITSTDGALDLSGYDYIKYEQ